MIPQIDELTVKKESKTLDVIHYQRKKRFGGNFSLEFIFRDLRNRLDNNCRFTVHNAPYESNGFLKRLQIVRDVRRVNAKNAIMHITGDINFAVLGTPRNSAVTTILDCGFLGRSRGLKRAILKSLWLNLPLSWSKVVTTISQHAKDEIVAKSRCNPEKIVVIPVAISDNFAPTPYRFNSRKPRLLHIGTAPNKNLLRLVEAIAGLQCTLSIVGRLEPRILKLLKNHSIEYENHVDIGQDAVVLEYAKADLVSFVSTYEGFGMPILESQAVGRPVITSNVSSMPEVAGVAACMVDPFDVRSIRAGIETVISNSEYRTKLIEKGFENVKRYDPSVLANQYLAVYQTVSGNVS